MSLYEHVFISRQDLSISQAEGLIEHFSTILSENGGKVLSQEYWGLKTMAYEINKNRKEQDTRTNLGQQYYTPTNC